MTTRPAPAPITTGRQGRVRRRATRRGRITRTVALSVTAVLGLAGVGEAAARHVLESRMADGVGRALGTRVTVDTGAGLALPALLGRRLGHVTLSGDNARLGRLTGASVRITLEGVDLAGPTRTVAQARATVTIPAGSLAEAIGDSGPGLPVSGARTDPATGTVLLALGPGGTGRLTLKPVLVDGRVTLAATDLQFLGRAITGPQLDRINTRLAERDERSDYPLSLTPVSLTVTPAGLAFTLASGPTELRHP